MRPAPRLARSCFQPNEREHDHNAYELNGSERDEELGHGVGNRGRAHSRMTCDHNAQATFQFLQLSDFMRAHAMKLTVATRCNRIGFTTQSADGEHRHEAAWH